MFYNQIGYDDNRLNVTTWDNTGWPAGHYNAPFYFKFVSILPGETKIFLDVEALGPWSAANYVVPTVVPIAVIIIIVLVVVTILVVLCCCEGNITKHCDTLNKRARARENESKKKDRGSYVAVEEDA